jgi:hypothetical protein
VKISELTSKEFGNCLSEKQTIIVRIHLDREKQSTALRDAKSFSKLRDGRNSGINVNDFVTSFRGREECHMLRREFIHNVIKLYKIRVRIQLVIPFQEILRDIGR